MQFTSKDIDIRIALLFLMGIFLRYFLMGFGYNYDFESYCIVGEIVSNMKSVYANTFRYNYGPFFCVIQGLFYRIAHINPDTWIILYRVLIVSLLTLIDLCIAYYIAVKHSLKKSLIFFLNPVSIIISGYHNQFDNIAILLAFVSCLFYNEEKKLNKKDILYIIFMSMSLIVKHIMFIFPCFLLFKKNLSMHKRLLYSMIPPLIFVFSFIPFALLDKNNLNGIINNVFLYRSTNNSPLLSIILARFEILDDYSFYIYLIIMFLVAFMSRKCSYEKQLCIYLLAMVAFSSAVANQYLVIPLAALCIFDETIWRNIYILQVSLFLILQYDGLNYLSKLKIYISDSLYTILNQYVKMGYFLSTWLLFICLLFIWKIRKWIDRCNEWIKSKE